MVREFFGVPISMGVLVDGLVNGFQYVDIFFEALLSVSGSLFIASTIGLDRFAVYFGWLTASRVQLVILFFAALYFLNLVFNAGGKIKHALEKRTQ